MMLHDEQLEEEFKKRLIDRFEDEINEVKDELEEFLSIGR